jgi:hypothetical protein
MKDIDESLTRKHSKLPMSKIVEPGYSKLRKMSYQELV